MSNELERTYNGSTNLWVMDFDNYYPDIKSFRSPQVFTEKNDLKLSSGCVSLDPANAFKKVDPSEVLVLGNIELLHFKNEQDVILQFHVVDDGLFNLEDNIFSNNYCQIEITLQRSSAMYTTIDVKADLKEIVCKPINACKFSCSCGKVVFHISGKLCSFIDVKDCIEQQHYIEFVTPGGDHCELRNGWVIDGRPMYQYVLRVEIQIKFTQNKFKRSEKMLELVSKQHLKTIGEKLLEDVAHTDFKVIVQGTIFPCHKCILAAQSEVLSAMLDSDFNEGQSQEWIIEDMSPETADCFLRFIYSADSKGIRDCPETALELLKAGHKYNIKSLENFCKEMILDFKLNLLDSQVAFELFAFSGNVEELLSLQDKAVEYFQTKSDVLDSGMLVKLIAENPGVAAKLLVKALERKRQDAVSVGDFLQEDIPPWNILVES